MPDKPAAEMTAEEVARALRSRLSRLERSDWNAYTWMDGGTERTNKHLYGSGASLIPGGKVSLTYVSYQGASTIDVDQARDYLEWLRAGNKGTHHKAEHAGVLRPSKAQEAAKRSTQAKSVAYERKRSEGWGDRDVLNAVYVPEGAATTQAKDVAEGDKVFYRGKWRTVVRNGEYVPKMPEQAHAVAAQMQDAVRMGDYGKAADLAASAKQTFEHLADGRDFEHTLAFAGGESVALTPETEVAVRPKAAPRRRRTGGPLKVYGVRYWLSGAEREEMGTERHRSTGRKLVATPTKVLALDAFGITSSTEAREVSETGNETEVALAMANPGKVVITAERTDKVLVREPENEVH